MSIEPGRRAHVRHVVGAADTARALGSGDVDVLATPRVVALCEAAAVASLEGALDQSRTSVGMHVELEHLTPVLPGATVVARARLERVEDRILHFAVEVTRNGDVVARGTHTRAVVDRKRFLERARGM